MAFGVKAAAVTTFKAGRAPSVPLHSAGFVFALRDRSITHPLYTRFPADPSVPMLNWYSGTTMRAGPLYL